MYSEHVLEILLGERDIILSAWLEQTKADKEQKRFRQKPSTRFNSANKQGGFLRILKRL